MRIGRVAAVLLLALSVSACHGGKAAATGLIATAQNEKKLVIGVKNDQPGIGLQSDGQYSGFDIEIAKIIAAGLGVPASGITWQPIVSADREKDLQQGTVDLVVASYSITAARERLVDFAGPYYVAGQDLLVPMKSAISGPQSLNRRTVCSVTASTAAATITSRYPDARLRLVASYSECVDELVSGKVDAVTTDDIILAGYASQTRFAGLFRVVGKPFTSEPYGIGLKKGDTAGCLKINSILRAAATAGTYRDAWDNTVGMSGRPAPTLDPAKLTNCH